MKFIIQYLSLTLCLFLSVCFCKSKTPIRLSEEEKAFADMYLQRIQNGQGLANDSTYTDTLSPDTTQPLTRMKFRQHLENFQENPEKWEAFFNYALLQIEAQNNKPKKRQIRLHPE